MFEITRHSLIHKMTSAANTSECDCCKQQMCALCRNLYAPESDARLQEYTNRRLCILQLSVCFQFDLINIQAASSGRSSSYSSTSSSYSSRSASARLDGTKSSGGFSSSSQQQLVVCPMAQLRPAAKTNTELKPGNGVFLS